MASFNLEKINVDIDEIVRILKENYDFNIGKINIPKIISTVEKENYAKILGEKYVVGYYHLKTIIVVSLYYILI